MTKREYLEYCEDLFEANAFSGPGSIYTDTKNATKGLGSVSEAPAAKKGLKEKAKELLSKNS
jgi:hypothetical protein